MWSRASSANRHRRHRTWLRLVGLGVVAAVILGTLLIATDTFGAGDRFDRLLARVDRFISGPPPDRAGVVTVHVTAPPSEEPTPSPTPTPFVSLPPGATPSPTPKPTPTPTPAPRKKAVDIDIVANPNKVFAHELKDTWCSPSGVQMALAVMGLANTSDAFQRELQSRVKGDWESYDDSHNGLWGPHAMALALEAYGAPGYEVRGYDSRLGAERDAAKAIQATGSPVLLLAWRGAHTWVMTGFKADSDPSVFQYSKIRGAYILDPWYPWNSSIWGQSDPPGTFQDDAEMARNFLPWKRPEGHYPDRDGLYIAVVPTLKAP